MEEPNPEPAEGGRGGGERGGGERGGRGGGGGGEERGGRGGEEGGGEGGGERGGGGGEERGGGGEGGGGEEEPGRTVKQEEEEKHLLEMGPPSEDEEDEEALPHSEILDIFEEGLARLVQDPLLCDLPIQVTLEEINSQIALEHGQAMTVRVLKADGETMPIVVVQNATVLDLKKAIRRFVELKQQRENGVRHVSWTYIWRTYHLLFQGEKLDDDKMRLKDFGIRNRDEVTFMKRLRKK